METRIDRSKSFTTYCKAQLLDIPFLVSPLQGHPKVLKTAVFDIVTPDVVSGVVASVAELLAMMSEVLDVFPSLSKNYEIHISHTASACNPIFNLVGH